MVRSKSRPHRAQSQDGRGGADYAAARPGLPAEPGDEESDQRRGRRETRIEARRWRTRRQSRVTAEIDMLEKAPEAFRTISEVADELDVPQHVLRFWETRFAQIKPMKRGGGRRYYRPNDVDLLKGIRAASLRRRLHDPRRAAHLARGGRRLCRERSAAARPWPASAMPRDLELDGVPKRPVRAIGAAHRSAAGMPGQPPRASGDADGGRDPPSGPPDRQPGRSLRLALGRTRRRPQAPRRTKADAARDLAFHRRSRDVIAAPSERSAAR